MCLICVCVRCVAFCVCEFLNVCVVGTCEYVCVVGLLVSVRCL